ncbi:SH3 domain-containing protein [uncultured Shimia sp.]|uniref:SH3 domain-containing protein n=1 Tax=uncultured Shimia sp. TaxID=573152 RepID=UPI0026237BE2|nr:SH3 domain-containing protein [uncultured Shimia sp.]
MKQLLALFFFLTFGVPAIGQDLPALFDVINVASDDELNVREDPSSTARIYSTLAFNARNVEVVDLSDEGDWGLVNTGESSGWVSMRYLALAPSDDWETAEAHLYCSGTEPFWSMSLNDPAEGQAVFAAMAEEGSRTFDIDWHGGQAGRAFTAIGLGGARQGHDSAFSAVIRREACHDGMSDRNFGLAIDLFMHSSGAPDGVSGCCSLQP